MLARLVPVAVLALSGIACVFHIDTAITDDLLTPDESLTGTWVGEDSTRAVIRGSGGRLTISMTERTDSGWRTRDFHGRQGSLAGRRVVEVWPAFTGDDMWPSGRFLAVIDVQQEWLRFWSLKDDSVRAAVRRSGESVPHLGGQYDVILTASSASLVATLTDYIGRPGFLEPGDSLRRVIPRE